MRTRAKKKHAAIQNCNGQKADAPRSFLRHDLETAWAMEVGLLGEIDVSLSVSAVRRQSDDVVSAPSCDPLASFFRPFLHGKAILIGS